MFRCSGGQCSGVPGSTTCRSKESELFTYMYNIRNSVNIIEALIG